MTNVSQNLAAIRARMNEAAHAAERDPDRITLVAVSKMQPLDRIEAALAAGHRRFGENRVQEAEQRWWPLRERYSDIALHLVGPLQTNKVKAAVALFDVIESVDRPKLARVLAAEMATGSGRPDCLIQVNTGEEPQKAGVAPRDLGELARLCLDELELPVIGLMCIPPVDDNPALHFAMLAQLAYQHGLHTVSMGMTHDFETAIRHGATEVRIGSGIFGERPQPDRA